jgi:hypothetical protein
MIEDIGLVDESLTMIIVREYWLNKKLIILKQLRTFYINKFRIYRWHIYKLFILVHVYFLEIPKPDTRNFKC